MQLAEPVSGILRVGAGRRVYVVVLGVGSALFLPAAGLSLQLRDPMMWLGISVAVIGPIVGWCLFWLSQLRLELTNESLTYRTFSRTRTFALAELRQPVVEVGEARGRPLVRLVVMPHTHPLKQRLDIPLKQLDDAGVARLLTHLGIRANSHHVVESWMEESNK
jgi:hypothetical protein